MLPEMIRGGEEISVARWCARFYCLQVQHTLPSGEFNGLRYDEQQVSLPKIAEILLVGMMRYFESKIELYIVFH